MIKCDPLEEYGFNEAMYESMLIMFALGALVLLAIFGLYYISRTKKVKNNRFYN